MGDFGVCPRVLCNAQPVLPVGPCCEVGKEYVHLYCPQCEDMYVSPVNKHKSFLFFSFFFLILILAIDGAAFGPSFPHIFFLQYPELVPKPVAELDVSKKINKDVKEPRNIEEKPIVPEKKKDLIEEEEEDREILDTRDPVFITKKKKNGEMSSESSSQK
jgi:casein kinase II subunit beta